MWGDQSIKRDHVYVKDVLSAIECAVKVPDSISGVYNIASGRAYSQLEEAKILAEVFATDKGVSEVTNCPEKQGLTRGYLYSIDKAKKELGWEPAYADMKTMYEDYKKEWLSKEYHNYHYIKPGQEPKSL